MPRAVEPSLRHRRAPSSCNGARQGCLGEVHALCTALAVQPQGKPFDRHFARGNRLCTSGLLNLQCCAHCEGLAQHRKLGLHWCLLQAG